jgi:eukaryotic-like serine/threonine-protein kinase
MLTGHYGPDELRRFLEEPKTAAGLSHTNIAHIYEVGEHEGTPFFSMEYVDGGTLADSLRKELPSPRNAAELLISIARALHHAHENGVVHRDMKPANVLLAVEGVPKVADFGIVKRLNDDSQLTRTGAVIGTPTYMAPEQAQGNSRHVGPPADVYSLGAILYELLAGRRSYRKITRQPLRFACLPKNRCRPPGTGPRFIAISKPSAWSVCRKNLAIAIRLRKPWLMIYAGI